MSFVVSTTTAQNASIAGRGWPVAAPGWDFCLPPQSEQILAHSKSKLRCIVCGDVLCVGCNSRCAECSNNGFNDCLTCYPSFGLTGTAPAPCSSEYGCPNSLALASAPSIFAADHFPQLTPSRPHLAPFRHSKPIFRCHNHGHVPGIGGPATGLLHPRAPTSAEWNPGEARGNRCSGGTASFVFLCVYTCLSHSSFVSFSCCREEPCYWAQLH